MSQNLDRLNLDDFEYQELELKGVVYKFKSPSALVIDRITGMDKEIDNKLSEVKQTEQMAAIINEVIPEIPAEAIVDLNRRQIRALVIYLTSGSSEAVEAIVSKKK